ncbi:SETMAR [Branchiostoma lanceolatum]|uniref:SETMAR protein n=1 Tax=Branchiostoma lanceolatum TaxID=7740 RepID=A0A8K0EMA5_BRALA|nr:SETMAR [Branchiostoma lanceolatum]
MAKTLGEDSPSYSTIKKWVANFKRGKGSVKDDPRSGRPKTATSENEVDAIHRMIMNDRRVTIRHIEHSLGISYGSVQNVLGKNKLSASLIFLKRFVTQDETWVHHFDPESKEQSEEWTKKGSQPPKKFKRVASVGKVMASVFWDSEGVIMINYLQKGQTINGEYYASELRQLKAAIKEKRRGKLRAGVLLLQDNAPVHTAHVSVAAATQCGFELLPHPPYSPDLAPSDFYLFPKLKFHLRGHRFETDDDVIHAVEAYLEAQDATYFQQGVAMLEHRWTKCIEVRGDYVEK